VPLDRSRVAKEIPKGRPLWLNEINKNVPPGANYSIASTFGAS
jgi:hypothetical protein